MDIPMIGKTHVLEYFYDSVSQTYGGKSGIFSLWNGTFRRVLSYSDDRGFGGVVNFDVGLTDAIGVEYLLDLTAWA